MSMLDQLDSYESPHKMPMYPMAGSNLDAHHRWYQARERYVTIGLGEEATAEIIEARLYWFNEMLESVSNTNPPVNRIELNKPVPKPEPERPRSRNAIAFIALALYIMLVATWFIAVVWVIT